MVSPAGIVARSHALQPAAGSSSAKLRPWPKLVRAAATEALANQPKDAPKAPSLADVETFLTAPESGQASTRALGDVAQHETRESADALRTEARTSEGRWIHRNFLATK